MVLPGSISDAIAAEWVIPEQPMVSTSASYDSVFDVECQLASSLLGGAPAYTVGQTRNVDDFFGFYPFPFFGNRCGAVVGAFLNNTHVFYFL